MKDNSTPNQLKLPTLAAGLAGLLLRQVLYVTGTDSKGLLPDFHWAGILLWILTLAVGILLVLRTKALPRETSGDIAPGAGCLILGAAVLISAFTGAPDKSSLLAAISRVLGIAAGVALAAWGISRFLHRQPWWLLPVIVFVFFTFRTVLKYRLWSSHPQLQDYFFYLGAHVCLMLASYYHGAAAAEMGTPRLLWIFSLGAVFFCCVAIPRSADPLFLLACGVWAFCNLSCPDSKPRRQMPPLHLEDSP